MFNDSLAAFVSIASRAISIINFYFVSLDAAEHSIDSWHKRITAFGQNWLQKVDQFCINIRGLLWRQPDICLVQN